MTGVSNERRERQKLLDWLVQWRQDRHGSVSPENHRKYLATYTTRQLRKRVEQIQSQEAGDERRERG